MCVSVVLFILAERYPDNTYFPNLAANAATMLVGVVLVEQLLRRHEDKRWNVSDARMGELVRQYAEAELVAIVLLLGTIDTGKVPLDRTSLSGYAATLEGRLLERLRTDRSVPYNQLRAVLTRITKRAHRLLVLAGSRSQPELRDTLLRLGHSADDIRALVDVHRDIALRLSLDSDLRTQAVEQIAVLLRNVIVDLRILASG